MAETDISAQEPLGKKSIPPHDLSYEEQLALVESMMTCYDTPIAQAAGYTWDLVKTVIALHQSEIALIKATQTVKEIANRNAQKLSLTPGYDKAEHEYYRGQYEACCTILLRASTTEREPVEHAKTKDLVNMIRMKLERRFQVADYMSDSYAEPHSCRGLVSDMCQDFMAHVREIHALAERALNSIENASANG